MIVLLLLQGYDIAAESLVPPETVAVVDPESSASLPIRLVVMNARSEADVEAPVPKDYAAHVLIQTLDGTVVRRPEESPAVSERRRLAFGEFFGREIDAAALMRGAEEGIYLFSWSLGDASSRTVPIVLLRRYRVRFETNLGEFSIVPLPQIAPRTVLNFIRLVREGFYSERGRTFHRIIPESIVQGGCPNDDGTGETDRIEDEFNRRARHLRGTVSMANKGRPNTASCQFFICIADSPSFDGRYAAFAQAADEKSMRIIDAIGEVETTHHKCPACNDGPCELRAPECEEHHTHKPLSPVTIKKVSLEVME